MVVARLAVSAATYAIDKPYDYLVPEELVERAVPGMRALVPFGIGNKKSEGVILSVVSESKHSKLKAIDSLLDDTPILDDDSIRLALWMSDRFFCTVFDAFHVMLPSGMWFKDGVKRQDDKTVRIAELYIGAQEASELALRKKARAPKQSAVLECLVINGPMPVSEITRLTGSSSATVSVLVKQDLINIRDSVELRRPAIRRAERPESLTLNSEQESVFDTLAPLVGMNKPEAALLYGVTGSGKTLVYIKLIERAISLGKTAIVLVPEIALTPQVVGIFASWFGDTVAVLHSALGAGERYDEWKRIRAGEVKVVVGTRSAVFAPLTDIGLIVIDEEQEHTYKSETSPRYHAREVAKYRVAKSGALLLLSSATPSVESMYGAKNGKYTLTSISNRYNEKELPPVIIADMKQEIRNGNGSSISSILRSHLEQNIENGEQSILFVNRRGTNPIVACVECGFTFKCDSCSVSMTYHSAESRLRCHYCGNAMRTPDECPDCGGKLKFIGAGTQKVEEELNAIFPDISIIRMDADTVTRKNSHDRLLSRFKDSGSSILLGTQMITKGLDFENVTLVGVISADSSLYLNDYRAHEKTFSLITQVIGRSGRGDKQGRAIIQTIAPGHEVLELASRQDYDSFYKREIFLREALGNPPINELFALTATGTAEQNVIAACTGLRQLLEQYFSGNGRVKLLGPAPLPVTKVKNKYRYRVIICGENTKDVRQTIAFAIKEFSKDKRSKGVSIFADVEVYE